MIEDVGSASMSASQEIDALVVPFSEAVALLETIPGVGHATACTIVAEIGVDMTRFPSPGHLVSWAGLCPELNESAGKDAPAS